MKENNTSRDTGLIEEIKTKGYYQRARTRAQRRKSPWNLILIPVCLTGCATTCGALFYTMWHVHTFIYPEHTGKLSEFWQEGIQARAFVSSFLLAAPLFFASLPIGMIFANLAARCIPAANRVFEKEAEGYQHTSFRSAMHDLLKISAFVVPICILLSLIGAVTLKELK